MGFISSNDLRDLERGLYSSSNILKFKKKNKNLSYNDVLFKLTPFILGFIVTVYIVKIVF